MGVAKGVNEIPDFQAADLRHHMSEQRVAGDIKWHAEENIGAALIELTGEFTVRDVKLEKTMTRRQSHLVNIGGVPCRDNMSARIRIGFDGLDKLIDLVNHSAIGPFPAPPLLAVDGAEIAVLIRPLIPDADFVLLEIFDVRIACEEPNQLMDDGFLMQLLGRDHRKALREIKTHLITKNPARARACAIHTVNAVIHNM